MSTAPQGWQNPKTNWQAADIVHPSDVNRIEGNIQAIETGSRTLDPSQAPTGNTGSLRQLLDWFANRVKAITGAANWYDAPATTLAATKSHMDAAKSHMDATSGVHGATSSATANRIIIRDSAGRAKVAAPSASDDIARKAEVDAVQANLNSHVGATSGVHGLSSNRRVATVHTFSVTAPTASIDLDFYVHGVMLSHNAGKFCLNGIGSASFGLFGVSGGSVQVTNDNSKLARISADFTNKKSTITLGSEFQQSGAVTVTAWGISFE